MENPVAPSPRILSSGWGSMEVEIVGRSKDCKLWPGGGRPWDWSEYGTGHGKGIQHGDIQELIARGCQVVILTTGRLKRLKVPKAIVDALEDQSIEVIVADTKKAIVLYNDYAEKGAAVGGLFHSTC
ncbi:MAG: MTH938/NDUFAF3 family protein [Desulforhopalus sp.]